MTKTIGIRKEDKNEWERRVPLIPSAIKKLRDQHGIQTVVQPSPIRIFSDRDYEAAGARISESLTEAQAIFAVKEIPVRLLEKAKTYVFFSHTIKGQPYNMSMLKKLMDLECNLIDYERITDSNGNRLIAFSIFAGMAGMIETLQAFGRKMERQGHRTPFATVKQAYQYDSEIQAKAAIKQIGREIANVGIPKDLHPLTIGILGYGNVSRGVQEILDLLPVKTLTPYQLRSNPDEVTRDNKCVYKIVFEEKDMVRRRNGSFSLQEYYDHPARYESVFHHYLPNLKLLLNTIYWTESYPRTVTRDHLQALFAQHQRTGPQIIGDISCDLNGSIEITKAATKPDNACYTYHADSDRFEDGIQASGVTVMAIDNLPCEFPGEASRSFSSQLETYVHDIVTADYGTDFTQLSLPSEIKKAVILLKGQLTPEYRYLESSVLPPSASV